jgi:hypothetical protein
MPADDASSAEMRRLPAKPDADPLALDDETVERLLRGELPPAQAPPGYAEVARLLAAATAPPSPGELAGQAAVLAELRAATRPRRAAIGARRAARPRRRRRTGLAIVVVAGALVTGGVAGAATGHLPGPVRDAARSIFASPGDGTPPDSPTRPGSPPDPGTTGGPASTGATTGPPGSQPTGTSDRGPASTASGLDNKGLCQAYLASKGGEQGKKLDTPALQALARAAGGEEKIAGYCADLLPGQAEPKDEKKDDKSQPGDQGQDQGSGQGGSPPSSGPGQDERAPDAGAPRR